MSLTLLHFNTRLLIRKFDDIEDELALLYTDIIFITATWLSLNHTSFYCLHGYNAFFSRRGDRTGGGISIYIRNNRSAIHLIGDVTVNNALNVCAASIDQGKFNTLLLAVLCLAYECNCSIHKCFNFCSLSSYITQ